MKWWRYFVDGKERGIVRDSSEGSAKRQIRQKFPGKRVSLKPYNAKNPGAFARCVKAVSAKGSAAYDPRAVCAASGRKKYGQAEMTRRAKAGKKRAARQSNASARWYRVYEGSKYLGRVRAHTAVEALQTGRDTYGPKVHVEQWSKVKRSNPPEAAREAYAGFHGKESDQVIKVTKTVHFHEHLWGLGKLTELVVEPQNGGAPVRLKGFKGAMLSANEKRTQLFVEGGDQKVPLGLFGVRSEHETQTLGKVRKVSYFTDKKHLGREGGTAVYEHVFSKPQPDLIYDSMNEQLSFSGGRYTIPDEGIDH
jgi:hypothetical protein